MTQVIRFVLKTELTGIFYIILHYSYQMETKAKTT